MGANNSAHAGKSPQPLINVTAVGNVKSGSGFPDNLLEEWMKTWTFRDPSSIDIFVVFGMKRFRKNFKKFQVRATLHATEIIEIKNLNYCATPSGLCCCYTSIPRPQDRNSSICLEIFTFQRDGRESKGYVRTFNDIFDATCDISNSASQTLFAICETNVADAYKALVYFFLFLADREVGRSASRLALSTQEEMGVSGPERPGIHLLSSTALMQVAWRHLVLMSFLHNLKMSPSGSKGLEPWIMSGLSMWLSTHEQHADCGAMATGTVERSIHSMEALSKSNIGNKLGSREHREVSFGALSGDTKEGLGEGLTSDEDIKLDASTTVPTELETEDTGPDDSTGYEEFLSDDDEEFVLVSRSTLAGDPTRATVSDPTSTQSFSPLDFACCALLLLGQSLVCAGDESFNFLDKEDMSISEDVSIPQDLSSLLCSVFLREDEILQQVLGNFYASLETMRCSDAQTTEEAVCKTSANGSSFAGLKDTVVNRPIQTALAWVWNRMFSRVRLLGTREQKKGSMTSAHQVLRLTPLMSRLGLVPVLGHLQGLDVSEAADLLRNRALVRQMDADYCWELHTIVLAAQSSEEELPENVFTHSFVQLLVNAAPRLGSLRKLRDVYSTNSTVMLHVVEHVLLRLQSGYRMGAYPLCLPDLHFVQETVRCLHMHQEKSTQQRATVVQVNRRFADSECGVEKSWVLVKASLRIIQEIVPNMAVVVNLLERVFVHVHFHPADSSIQLRDVRWSVLGTSWGDADIDILLKNIVANMYKARRHIHVHSGGGEEVDLIVKTKWLSGVMLYWNEVLHTAVVATTRTRGFHEDDAVTRGWLLLRQSYLSVMKTIDKCFFSIDNATNELLWFIDPSEYPEGGTAVKYLSADVSTTTLRDVMIASHTSPLPGQWYGFTLVMESGLEWELFAPSTSLRDAWVLGLKQSLRRRLTNLRHLSDGSIVEEWFEHEVLGLTWSPVTPCRFYDRHLRPLPLPDLTAPLHWEWVPLTEGSSLSTRPSIGEIINRTNSTTRRLLGDMTRLASDGWEYASKLDAPYSSSKEGENGVTCKYRRRKWVRQRTLKSGLGELLRASAIDSPLPVGSQCVAQISPYDMMWEGPPTAAHVAFVLARSELNEHVQSENEPMVIFSTLVHLAHCDPLHSDLQRWILEQSFTLIDSSDTTQRTDILDKLLQMDPEGLVMTSGAHLSVYLVVLWQLLVSQLASTYQSERGVFPLAALVHSDSIYLSQEFQTLDSVRVLHFWVRFLIWHFQQDAQLFQRSWTIPPTYSDVVQWLTHSSPGSVDPGSLAINQSELAISDKSLMDGLLELFRCKNLMSEDIVKAASDKRTHTQQRKAAVEEGVNTKEVWKSWWQQLDRLASLPALEFSFEAYSVLAGLRSVSELQALFKQETTDTLQALLTVWESLGIAPEKRSLACSEMQCSNMESVLQFDIAWAGTARRHLSRVFRVLDTLFHHEPLLVQSAQQLVFCFDQMSLRSLWKELHVSRSVDDSSDAEDWSAACIPPLAYHIDVPTDLVPRIPDTIFRYIPWLSCMDDWRLQFTVIVSGARGKHAAMINGAYSLSQDVASNKVEGSGGGLSVFVRALSDANFVELSFDQGTDCWRIVFRSGGRVPSGSVQRVECVLAQIRRSELDTHGNQAKGWEVNASDIGQPPTFIRDFHMIVYGFDALADNSSTPDVYSPVDPCCLFLAMWRSASVSAHSIESVLTRWKEKYFDRFDNNALTYSYMTQVSADLDNNRANLHLFFRVISSPPSLKGHRENPDWVRRQFQRMEQFGIYSQIDATLADILDARHFEAFSAFADGFLSPEAIQQRTELWSTLATIRSNFASDASLSDMMNFHIPGSTVALLLQLDKRLVEVLISGKEILEWMRNSSTLQSDVNFQVQLECIQAKDVSMLPDEIPTEQAKEQAVTEVAAIRSCFQKLLVHETFASIDSFLACIVNLQVFQSAVPIDQIMSHCAATRDALIELFEEQDELVIPNKLLSYSHPGRHSTWHISRTGVTFTIQSLRNAQITTTLTMDNLTEFQSKLNLTHSSTLKQATGVWVDAFNQQLKWASLLQGVLGKLHDMGHPEYITASTAIQQMCVSYDSRVASVSEGEGWIEGVATFPFSVEQVDGSVTPFPYDRISEFHHLAEEKLAVWSAHTNTLLQRYYHMNLFSMNQIWSVIVCLENLSLLHPSRVGRDCIPGADPEMSEAYHLYLLNTFEVYGYRDISLNEAVHQWSIAKTSMESDSHTLTRAGGRGNSDVFPEWSDRVDVVRVFGVWTEAIFEGRSVVPRAVCDNPAELSKIKDEHALKSGLNLIELQDGSHLLDAILTVFAHYGSLPEREYLVICEPGVTTLAEVEALVMRWGGAHNNGREDCTYCLAGTEHLSTEHQRSLTIKIQRLLNESRVGREACMAQLVVLIGGKKRQQQYMFQAFAYVLRERFPLLSSDILERIVAYAAARYANQSTTYVSALPGHGKTFQIASAAKQDSQIKDLVHVPCHFETNKGDLIRQVNSASRRSDRSVLWVEVGSVRNAVATSNALFELIFLSGLVHFFSAEMFCWRASEYSRIMIEISNRSVVSGGRSERIRICELLPCVRCELTERTFQASLEGLMMGHWLSLEGQEAHYALRNVIVALHLFETREVFPGNFWEIAAATHDSVLGSSVQMHALLKRHFQLSAADSGHRLWSMVKMFHLQLENVFHVDSYVSNTYAILPSFFVKKIVHFLLLTLVDICQPAKAGDEAGKIQVIPWQDLSHEFLCTQSAGSQGQSGGGLSFLCLDKAKSNLAKFPDFVGFLTDNGITVDTAQYEKYFVGAINSIIGTHRTQEEADGLMGGHNCITKDSVMKMIALFSRLRSGIPVVLMGECGCGKTQLIEYTCAYWGVELVKLDCHGGTSAADIESLFTQVEERCRQEAAISRGGRNNDRVFVFLDEINTCVHVDLITEIIINHSLNGRKLHRNIVVLGALNPYRWKTVASDEVSGLVYEQAPSLAPSSVSAAASVRLSSGIDRNLVYKVHPIPDTLLCFIYDFGSLDIATESLYISAMLRRELIRPGRSTSASTKELHIFSRALLIAQEFSRRVGGDASVVSLRDVRRCVRLVNWFESNPHNAAFKAAERQKPLSWAGDFSLRSYVLALALVYHYRIQEREHRTRLWELIATSEQWPLDAAGALAIVAREEQLFCDNLAFEEDTATNEALKENVFVTISCVSNKIPVMLVGKPGSSKTLTISVMESNLRGAVSRNAFWSNYPAVTVFSYQCSPLSRAQGILSQYQKACRFQESQTNRTVTVLLLDEIGLAEHSPDMPLKILHQLLPEERVAVIGISNWALDPAKMNRAILINRPDPTAADLEKTGAVISNIRATAESGSTVLNATILKCLARAFHEVYTEQQTERPFFGMRDYYSLLKLIRRSTERSFGWRVLMRAICRNFGGKREFLNGVIAAFMKQYAANRSLVGHFFGSSLDTTPLSTFVMIAENLKDQAARHLMVITQHKIAFSVMLGCGLLSIDKTEVLIGSQFLDDCNEYSLVTSVNRVKDCMVRGRTLVLINHNDMYESLYDVLNQRTVKRDDKGRVTQMLRLAIGANSHLCPVSPNFRVIVIVDEEEAYRSLDVPLLSRFEKQNLTAQSVVGVYQGHNVAVWLLEQWSRGVAKEVGLALESVFPRYHASFIATYALALSRFDESFWPEKFRTIASKECGLSDILPFVTGLMDCMTPIAVSRLKKFLPAPDADARYFDTHDSLSDLIVHRLQTASGGGVWSRDITFATVRTWSQAAMFVNRVGAVSNDIIARLRDVCPTMFVHDYCHLASFKSERELRDSLTKVFFSKTVLRPSLLIVQCDSASTSPAMLDHVRFICEDLRRGRLRWSAGSLSVADRGRFLTSEDFQFTPQDLSSVVPVIPLHVVLLIHDPPAVSRTASDAHVHNFYTHWQSFFLDDICPVSANADDGGGFSTRDLLQLSTLQVAVNHAAYVVHRLIPDHFRDALFSIRCPGNERSTVASSPVLVSYLLQDAPFIRLLLDGVILVLTIRDAETNHMKALSRSVNGSARQSLVFAFEEAVVRALTLFLSVLNRNENLALLDPSMPDAIRRREQWFHMITDCARVDGAAGMVLSESAKEHYRGVLMSPLCRLNSDGTVNAINDGGRAGYFRCRVPFSYRLVSFLSSDEFSRVIQDTAGTSSEHLSTQAMCVASKLSLTFGDAINTEVNPTDYLLDLLDCHVLNSDGYLSLEIAKNVFYSVCRGIMATVDSACFTSIALIHPVLWACGDLLQAVLTIVDTLNRYSDAEEDKHRELFDNIVAYVDSCIDSNTHPDSSAVPNVMYQMVANFFLSCTIYNSNFVALIPLLSVPMDRILQEVLLRSSANPQPPQEIENLHDWLHLLPLLSAEASLHFPQCAAAVFRSVLERRPGGLRLSCREGILWLGECVSRSLREAGAESYLMISVPTIVEGLLRRVLQGIVFPFLAVSMTTPDRENSDKVLGLLDFLSELCCAGVVVLHRNSSQGTTTAAQSESQSFRCLQRVVMEFLMSSEVSIRVLERHVVDELRKRCEQDECPLCFECPMMDPVVTSCRHTFCRHCISAVQQQAMSCPYCRAENFTIKGPVGSSSTLMETTVLMLQWEMDVVSESSDRERWFLLDDTPRLHNIVHQPVLTSIQQFGIRITCRVLALVQLEILNFVEKVGSNLEIRHDSESSLSRTRAHNRQIVSVLSSTTASSEWPNIYALRCLFHKFGRHSMTALLGLPDTQLPLPWLASSTQRHLLQRLFPPENVPALDPFYLDLPYRQCSAALVPTAPGNTQSKLNLLCARQPPPYNTARSVLLLHSARAAVECYCAKDWRGAMPPQLAELYAALKRPQNGIMGVFQGESFWTRLDGSDAARDTTRLYEQHLYSFWLTNQVQATLWLGRLAPSTAHGDILRFQVIAHVVAIALRSPGGWLASLLVAPHTLKHTFLPSMPEDEVLMVLKGLDRKSAKRAYMCKCGALYFIGDCGQPWVVAKCPQCGLDLGGQRHELVATSRAVNDDEVMSMHQTLPGYLQHSTAQGDVGRDLSPATVCVLRLAIHACLVVSSSLLVSLRGNSSKTSKEFASTLKDSIVSLLRGQSTGRGATPVPDSLEALQAWAQNRFLQDWTQLRHCLALPDDDTAVVVHALVSSAGHLFATPSGVFSSQDGRRGWEINFQREVVEPVVGGVGMSERVERIAELARTEQQAVVATSAGANQALQETECMHLIAQLPLSSSPVNSDSSGSGSRLRNSHMLLSLESVVWSYRSRICVEDFHSQFFLSHTNKSRYPLIAMALQKQNELASMDAMVHIFRWHQLLFETFQQGALTREEARILRNQDVLSRLPLEQKSRGAQLLAEFIRAFNTTFPLVENLFECQTNHLRNTLVMDENTPLIFSLPSRGGDGAGSEAGEGICTVAVVEMLRNRQNEMMGLFQELGGAGGEAKVLHAPAINQSTPETTLRRLLFLYNPREHFLPLLYRHAEQGLGFGEGRELSYDLDRLQEALVELVCTGKQKVALQLTLYEYAGEIHRTGMLAQLCRVVKQRELPVGLEDTLLQELSVHSHIRELLRLLEAAIRFLATGSTGVSQGHDHGEDRGATMESTALGVLITDIMGTPKDVWLESSTPTLRSAFVTLALIAQLFTTVERGLGVEAFSRVDSKYRTPLPSHLEALVIARVVKAPPNEFHWRLLIPLLSAVLTDNLSDNVAIRADASLKDELLCYIEGFDEVKGYAVHFPQEIRIEHCFSLHKMLSAAAGANTM